MKLQNKSTPRFLIPTSLALATALALGACGSDDDRDTAGDGDGNQDVGGDGDVSRDGDGSTTDGDESTTDDGDESTTDDGDGSTTDDGDGDITGDGMGGSSGDGDGMGGGSGDGETVSFRVTLQNLEPLGGGFEYEGWFIHENGPVSAGRFNLEKGKDSVDVDLPAASAEGAMMYVLTIEPPAADDDPKPSDTHVLAGPWKDGEATLSINAGAALADDFTGATGQFFLQTPTSAAKDDYSQGIWFIAPGGTVKAGLALPELPAGWAYEGWVAGPDGPVSTGRFTDPADADDDAGGPAAGPGAAPPFPGQDFIEPALDLVSAKYAAVISVEPMPDDSDAPFAFKPLVGMIADEGAGVVQMMDNMAENAPSGTVEEL